MIHTKIALLDSGIDKSHPVFQNVSIKQYVYMHNRWQINEPYVPKHGHGTGIASILTKNTKNIDLSSYVLFEEKLSVDVNKLIGVLQFILESGVHYDIIHMSFGVKFYYSELARVSQLA